MKVLLIIAACITMGLIIWQRVELNNKDAKIQELKQLILQNDHSDRHAFTITLPTVSKKSKSTVKYLPNDEDIIIENSHVKKGTLEYRWVE